MLPSTHDEKIDSLVKAVISRTSGNSHGEVFACERGVSKTQTMKKQTLGKLNLSKNILIRDIVSVADIFLMLYNVYRMWRNSVPRAR